MMFVKPRATIDPSLARGRAARGADWFDAHHRDWWSAIRLEEFKVANHSKCVAAWVYKGDYAHGLNQVVLAEGKPRQEYTLLIDLGLDAPLGPDREREVYHGALQVAWVNEISGRQGRVAR